MHERRVAPSVCEESIACDMHARRVAPSSWVCPYVLATRELRCVKRRSSIGDVRVRIDDLAWSPLVVSLLSGSLSEALRRVFAEFERRPARFMCRCREVAIYVTFE